MGASWAEISCEVPTEMLDEVAAFLVELSGNGVSIENLSLDTFSLDDIEETPTKTVKAYFPADTNLEAHVAALSTYLGERGASCPGFIYHPPAIAYLKEEEWATSWKKHFKPTRIAKRIVIKPTWEEFTAGEGDIVIELDPGQAFGTGTHPTTKLCLESLERIFSREESPDLPTCLSPATVLDVGTGSGILSIAAAKLGAGNIVAIDIDPGAVAVAKDNLALNHITDTVTVATTPLRDVTGTYDIVVANILAEELVRLGPDLAAKVRRGGFLILSGILCEREAFVTTGFAPRNLTLLRTTRESEWSCLTYHKAV